MWIPKDERRLLTGYYNSIGTLADDTAFRLSSLAPALDTYRSCTLHQYGDEPDSTPISSDNAQMRKEMSAYFESSKRVRHANELLAARGLIKTTDHQHEHDVIVVALTVDGYDLGRKYASGWIRTGLWFAEYKDHWLWLVLGFFGGILGAIFIKILEQPLFQ